MAPEATHDAARGGDPAGDEGCRRHWPAPTHPVANQLVRSHLESEHLARDPVSQRLEMPLFHHRPSWPVSDEEASDETARLLGRLVSSVGQGGQQVARQVRVGGSRLVHIGEAVGDKLGGDRVAPDGPLHQAEREASEISIGAHRTSMALMGGRRVTAGWWCRWSADQAAAEVEPWSAGAGVAARPWSWW